ncbi:hypothetical protein AAHC03_012939 [Spirometra sp. Aus1]
MNVSLLILPLSCLAIGLCITSLALPYWNCGYFFSICLLNLLQLISVVLFCGGLFIVSVVFITDVCGVCSDSWLPGQVCATLRVLFNAVGVSAMLAGNILYAFIFIDSWSFVLSLTGSVIAFHVVLLSLFTSRCLQNR